MTLEGAVIGCYRGELKSNSLTLRVIGNYERLGRQTPGGDLQAGQANGDSNQGKDVFSLDNNYYADFKTPIHDKHALGNMGKFIIRDGDSVFRPHMLPWCDLVRPF